MPEKPVRKGPTASAEPLVPISQVLQRAGVEGGVLGARAERAGGHRLEARELQWEDGFAEVGGEGGWRDLNPCPGTVNSLINVQHA